MRRCKRIVEVVILQVPHRIGTVSDAEQSTQYTKYKESGAEGVRANDDEKLTIFQYSLKTSRVQCRRALPTKLDGVNIPEFVCSLIRKKALRVTKQNVKEPDFVYGAPFDCWLYFRDALRRLHLWPIE